MQNYPGQNPCEFIHSTEFVYPTEFINSTGFIHSTGYVQSTKFSNSTEFVHPIHVRFGEGNGFLHASYEMVVHILAGKSSGSSLKIKPRLQQVE